MPKRSYRKKSGRKVSRKGSRKGSKKSYRKKGSRKGSRKVSRKGSKKVSKRRTIRKTRKVSPCKDLDEAECGYNPSCEYKTNKFGTKYCKSRSGTLYKKKLSKRLTKVQGPMGPPAGYKFEEKKEELPDYLGDLEFNLPALGYRIKKSRKGSKKSRKGSKKSRKGSKKSRKGSKKARKASKKARKASKRKASKK